MSSTSSPSPSILFLGITRLLTLLVLVAVFCVLPGCNIDRDAAEYDKIRYNALQDTECEEVAMTLSKPLLSKQTENYDKSLKRCQSLQAMSFEEYVRYADNARKTGEW